MESEELQSVISNKIRDMDLIFLTNMVNATTLSIGVTLLVKGTTVTGMLISGKKYYEETSKKIKETSVPQLAEYFDKVQKFYEKSEDSKIPNEFLHLENVTIIAPNNQKTHYLGGHFRIKIQEIDGFCIGSGSQKD